MPKSKVPEIFFTDVRKVEAVGMGCIRVYCALERNGAFEDQVTLLIPIGNALANGQFVSAAGTEIAEETKIVDDPMPRHH